MVQCEMCGAETASPRTAKIEGAELQVCDDCVEFGTEIRQESTSGTTAKYSTDSASPSAETSSSKPSRSSSPSGSGSRRRRDPFEDMEEIAPDYDTVIRRAREDAGLSREELGQQLSEKASLIGKLERGESLPSDDVRRKLERALDIELVAGGGGDADTDWSGGSESAGMTLGDLVERKD